MEPMETAPKDGTYILIYTGKFWELAFYDGAWFGAHHSSWHGNLLREETLIAWMPQPPEPEEMRSNRAT